MCHQAGNSEVFVSNVLSLYDQLVRSVHGGGTAGDQEAFICQLVLVP